MKIRIATRGSDLAVAQARYVAGRIENELKASTELVILQTQGDRILDRPLAEIGGKGLFIKEIEEALIDGRADVAVHSAKDLPAEIPNGLVLAAFPEREDCRDALVSCEPGMTLASLPQGARVGTSSVRRTALLRMLRPDLSIVSLRGNVQTRLRKLKEERLDAVMLACAGLMRLGLAEQITERLAPETFLPAVGQGVLALETRAEDPVRELIVRLNDAEVASAITAERAFLHKLEGDCSVPLAGYARLIDDRTLDLRCLLSSLDGKHVVTAHASGRAERAAELGAEVADKILSDGGEEILAELAAGAAAST
jgi:hydroxymethylbilane synthase